MRRQSDFKKPLNNSEFVIRFNNEETSLDFIIGVLYPDGVCSPYTWRKNISHRSGRIYQCNDVNKSFSALKDTIFDNSKIPLHIWMNVLWLFCKSGHGINAKEIVSNYPEISLLTARNMLLNIFRICSHIVHCSKLKGEINIDEKYYGGKEKNRSSNAKLKNPLSTGKIPVIGIGEKGGRAVMCVDTTTNSCKIKSLIEKYVTQYSIIVTDSSKLYDFLDTSDGLDYLHRSSNHGEERYQENGYNSNAMEGLFSRVFNNILCLFRSPSRRLLQRYVDAMCFLHNTRECTNLEKVKLLIINSRCNLSESLRPVNIRFYEDGKKVPGRFSELAPYRKYSFLKPIEYIPNCKSESDSTYHRA